MMTDPITFPSSEPGRMGRSNGMALSASSSCGWDSEDDDFDSVSARCGPPAPKCLGKDRKLSRRNNTRGAALPVSHAAAAAAAYKTPAAGATAWEDGSSSRGVDEQPGPDMECARGRRAEEHRQKPEDASVSAEARKRRVARNPAEVSDLPGGSPGNVGAEHVARVATAADGHGDVAQDDRRPQPAGDHSAGTGKATAERLVQAPSTAGSGAGTGDEAAAAAARSGERSPKPGGENLRAAEASRADSVAKLDGIVASPSATEGAREGAIGETRPPLPAPIPREPHGAADDGDSDVVIVVAEWPAGKTAAASGVPSTSVDVADQPSPRVKDLVLENLQKYRWQAPERIQLSPDSGTASVLSDEQLARVLQQQEEEERLLLLAPGLEYAPLGEVPSGLCFCHVCQKELTHMNSVRRQQHINRCLDDQEQLGPGQAPASAGGAGVAAAAAAAVPECPICGRHFQTEKARAGHLKRCARELHVASRDLVLAVQRQQAQAGTAAPPAIATAAAAGRALGAAPRRKKDKTGGSAAVRGRGGGGLPSERPPPTDEEEQMRVALAMSASLMELEERAHPGSTGLLQPKLLPDKAAPKKARRRKNAGVASALLQADPAATVRRLAEKMAVLLVPDTELEQEVASRRTPPLPPSRLLPSPASSSVPAAPPPPPWCRSAATALLWKRSALLTADLQGEAPFLCPALVPPLSPGGPVPTGAAQKQLSFSETIIDAPANPVGDRVSLRQTPQAATATLGDSSLRNSQPGLAEWSVGGCAGDASRGGGGCGIGGTGGGGGSSASELGRSGEWQQEVSGSQTLLALVELAREGLPLTQFMQDLGEPLLPSCTGAIEEMSGFLPETEPCVSPCPSELHGAGPAQHSSAGPSLSAARLVADLSEMVNNPHMSDVQLQVDTGELAYAHMFMLYARCPALMQEVFTEGFDAVCERGEAQGRRVIVHDASLDAVLALLHFVYTGSLHVAPSALSETRALADRFELSDLLSACASPPVSGGGGVSPRPSYSGAAREGDAAIRELLRSLWEHEEEEEEEEDGGRDGEAVKARRHDDGDDGDDGDNDDGIGDSDLDEVYEFAATQRRACGRRRRGSADAASERLGSNSDGASGLDGEEEESAAAAAASVKDGASDASAARSPRANDTFAGGSSSEAGTVAGTVAGAAVASASSGPDDSYERMFTEEDASGEYAEPSPVTPSARRPLPRAADVCERAGSTRPRPGRLGEGCDDPSSRSPYRFGPAASSPFRMKKRSPGRRRPTIGVDPHLQYSLCEAERSHFDRSPFPRHPSPASVPPSPQRPSPVRQSPGVAVPHPVTPPCLTALSPGSPALLAAQSANDTVPTSSPHATSNHPSPGRAGRSIARALRKQRRHLASEFDALLCAGGEDGPVRARADEGVTPEPSSKFHATSSIGSSVSETSVNLRPSTDSEIGSGEVSWLIPGTPGAASRSCGVQTLQSCLLAGARGASSPGPDHGHGHALIDLTLSPHEGSSYASLFSGGSSARGSGGARRRDEGTDAARCPSLDADDALESAVIVLDDSLERSPTGEFLLPALPAPARDERVISLAEIGSGSPERCSLGDDPRPDSRDLVTGRARVSTSAARVSTSAAGDSGGELSGRYPATPDELPQRTPQRDDVPLPSGSAASPWQSGCFARMELSLRERLLSRLAGPSFHTQEDDEDRLTRTQCAAAAAADGTAAAGEEPAASPPAPDVAFDSWNPGEEQLCGLGLGSPDSLAGATTPVHEARGAGRQLQAGSATPMPCYSDMETPHLKKELNRFGVRALPKRKMVLKLKEIYHYTHPGQDPNLDPGDRRAGASAVVAAQKRPRGKGRPPRSGQPAPTLPRPPVGGSTSEETAASSDAERQLQNQSQESTRSSRVSSSHTGEDSDSSGREEFADPTFLLEEGVSGDSGGADDDEEDGGVTASQHALRAEEREAAVLAFIRSRPELHRAMLLYRPFELSELQCQMRQAGLRVPAAALLDILDAFCVTFTMAGARRSKQSGRAKRGGRGGGAGRGSPGKRGKRKASVTSPRKAKRKKKDAPI